MDNDTLVIGIWIPADTAVKQARRVRVFPDWAKIEDPKILSVTMFQEFLGVFPAIAVEPFHA